MLRKFIAFKRLRDDKTSLRNMYSSLKQLSFIYTSRCISQSLISFLFNPLKSKKISREWSNTEANHFLDLANKIYAKNSPTFVKFDPLKSHRTPFGYSQLYSYYRSIFIPRIKNLGASIYVSGMSTGESHAKYAFNNEKGYYHISEEPLWDLLYNNVFDGNYQYQGFCNDFFKNLNVPYFLLTDTKYIERYNLAFSNILDNLNSDDILSIWSTVRYKFAAVCEYRRDSKWAKYLLIIFQVVKCCV